MCSLNSAFFLEIQLAANINNQLFGQRLRRSNRQQGNGGQRLPDVECDFLACVNQSLHTRLQQIGIKGDECTVTALRRLRPDPVTRQYPELMTGATSIRRHTYVFLKLQRGLSHPEL